LQFAMACELGLFSGSDAHHAAEPQSFLRQ
jgi:hypothetical protein